MYITQGKQVKVIFKYDQLLFSQLNLNCQLLLPFINLIIKWFSTKLKGVTDISSRTFLIRYIYAHTTLSSIRHRVFKQKINANLYFLVYSGPTIFIFFLRKWTYLVLNFKRNNFFYHVSSNVLRGEKTPQTPPPKRL